MRGSGFCRIDALQQFRRAFSPVKQYDYAAPRLRDNAQRVVHVPGMGIVAHIEQIDDGKWLVHPHQRFGVRIDFPFTSARCVALAVLSR